MKRTKRKINTWMMIGIIGFIIYVLFGFDGKLGMSGWIFAVILASGLLDGE